MHDNDYISLISEIFQGYTELSYKGDSVFLRHINIHDQNRLSKLVEKITAEKIARGIPSEKDRLDQLKQDKEWTDDDELKIAEIENYVKNLLQSKKKYALPSQQKEAQKLIDEEAAKLNDLRQKKRLLIGPTAEDFAARKANEEFLRHLIYSDENCSRLHFSDEEFGAIEPVDLNSIYDGYQRMMTRFSDENVQKAVLCDFFNMYLPFCEKPWDFYGVPLIKSSVFQQKVLVYGRMFLNIFQNVEKIPDHIRQDPKALLDFADSSRNKDKAQSKNSAKEGSTSFVMGTREDAEYMAGDGVEVGDLAEELKANNGFMDQETLLKRLGVLTH
jgi:hypothetical protein